jgi:hypothetical protein
MTVAGRAVTASDLCPHGVELGKCSDPWCQSRVDDLLHGEYEARPLEAPESSGEARSPAALEQREQRLTWREHFSELERIGVRPSLPERAEALSWAHKQHTGTCGGCRGWWRGERVCHCASCHLTFTSIGPFDAHRDGPMNDRRCRTEPELRQRGYEPNDSGYWRQPMPADVIHKKGSVPAHGLDS